MKEPVSIKEVPHHILEEMVGKFSRNVERMLAGLEESIRVTHGDLEFWFGPKENRPPSNRRVSAYLIFCYKCNRGVPMKYHGKDGSVTFDRQDYLPHVQMAKEDLRRIRVNKPRGVPAVQRARLSTLRRRRRY